MKPVCWLCVDRDGTEKVTNSIPIRRQYKRRRILSVFWGLMSGRYTKNEWDRWCDGFSSDSGNFLPFSGVVLPKGTIEKITGTKLTWVDEPVKLN